MNNNQICSPSSAVLSSFFPGFRIRRSFTVMKHKAALLDLVPASLTSWTLSHWKNKEPTNSLIVILLLVLCGLINVKWWYLYLYLLGSRSRWSTELCWHWTSPSCPPGLWFVLWSSPSAPGSLSSAWRFVQKWRKKLKYDQREVLVSLFVWIL